MKRKINLTALMLTMVLSSGVMLPVSAADQQMIVEGNRFYYDENVIRTDAITGWHYIVTNVVPIEGTQEAGCYTCTIVNGSGQITKRIGIFANCFNSFISENLKKGDLFTLNGRWATTEADPLIYPDGTVEPGPVILLPDDTSSITVIGNAIEIFGNEFDAVLDRETALPRNENVNQMMWRYTSGDVNGDAAVNASDAAVILISAAKVGAGGELGLTDAEKAAADYNSDGDINASDAAQVLIQAAKAGAGA